MLRPRSYSTLSSRSASWLSPLLIATLLAGCGGSGGSKAGGGGTPGLPGHIYVADFGNGSGTIFQYAMSSTGIVTPLSPSSFVTPPKTDSLTVSPDGTLLYAAQDNPSPTFGQYLIGSDGTLSANAAPTVATDNTPGGGTFTPDGKFFLGTNFGAASLKAFSVGVDGASTLTSTIATGSQPENVVTDATGHFAYVTNFNAGNISEYSLTSNGSLGTIGSVGAGAGPYGITRSGSFVYVCNIANSSISEYTINAGTGALVDQGVTISSGAGVNSDVDGIVTDPTGKFAYASNDGGTGNATITCYKIGSNGNLSKNGNDVTIGATSTFQYIAIDRSGHFIATLGTGTQLLTMYKINADGTLTAVGTPTSVNANIAGLAFGP
jgi:6-phosphogluconolactonase (cycloisomerase 2 family)